MVTQQVGSHQRSFWRNPEAAFFTFAMPLGVLLIFGATGSDDTRLFVPGILAFAIVVVAYGNLAATVATQRAEGVLKRIRATPLNPTVYLAGHLASTVVTAALMSVATVALGAGAFGALPRASAVPQLVAVLVLGTACFASLGLAVSAVIPTPDAAGAITNGTYLPLAMVSGMFSATLRMPRMLDVVIGAFPLKALADGLRSTYAPGGHLGAQHIVVLAVWTAAGVLLARRFFRWDP